MNGTVFDLPPKEIECVGADQKEKSSMASNKQLLDEVGVIRYIHPKLAESIVHCIRSKVKRSRE